MTEAEMKEILTSRMDDELWEMPMRGVSRHRAENEVSPRIVGTLDTDYPDVWSLVEEWYQDELYHRIADVYGVI